MRPRTLLIGTVMVAIAVRLVLATELPVTSDEAYFHQWGLRPALGFWDHPPMIGWLLALVGQFSHDPLAIRLPAVLLLGFVAWAVFALASPAGEARAALAAASVVLIPPEFLNVLITTDTPLVFFSLASVMAYARALREGRLGWYAAAGILLGLAALSKYFAALLAFAYFAFALLSPRAERRWPGLMIVYAFAAPFVIFNLAWNWQHCWANVMFNFVVRHDDAGLTWRRPALYLVTMLYATSVVALVQLARARAAWPRLWRTPDARLILLGAAVPLAVFALLSTVKTIGLHWLFTFVPLVFVVAALALTEQQLRRGVVFLASFSALHLAALAVVASLPLETWSRSKSYDGLVMTVKPELLLAGLEPHIADHVLAAEGYSPAITLSYSAGRHVPVFGYGSSHARHDDILTDWRAFAGRNIAVVRKTPPLPADYEPYFESVRYVEVAVAGARFHVVLGRGFRFEPYREQVLTAIRDRYYRIPSALPQGRCFFCEKYFDARTCPTRPLRARSGNVAKHALGREDVTVGPCA